MTRSGSTRSEKKTEPNLRCEMVTGEKRWRRGIMDKNMIERELRSGEGTFKEGVGVMKDRD